MKKPDWVGEDPRPLLIVVALAVLLVAAIAWCQLRESLGEMITSSCEQSPEDN